MKNFSELYLPDFQQEQRYHNNLLDQATRKRFTRGQAGRSSPGHFPSGRGFASY